MTRIPLPFKQIAFIVSLLLAFFFTFQIVTSLSLLRTTVDPEVYFARIAIALAFFFIPIFGGWLSFQIVGGVLMTAFAAVMALFAASVAKTTIFSWFLAEYGLLCFVLFRLDDYFENIIADFVVDREKTQNEINDLEVSYKTKGEGISIYFEKYSTYYHLRKMAEELVSSLSVSQLSGIIVKRCAELIAKGDIALIALADLEGRHLSVVASESQKPDSKVEHKQGDSFDQWVIRSRKRLIVFDAHQDFRFDITQAILHSSARSLIIVPLLHEGRVIGTLRVNSVRPETFNNDDLRLLDAISTLASSAVSNAMLYEKTEELAIRDSLTGCFLRRYFFERLKQEHRRFLLSRRPLSLLMCDLDHFKATNDRFGHGAGDLMLVRFCEILKESVGAAFTARYGGEEFAVLLTETSKEDAEKVAEKIRENVDKGEFVLRREKISMTVSIGVASIPDDTLDVESLVEKADKALYRAKREGRNRVCLSMD